jgi:hypothetical protein
MSRLRVVLAGVIAVVVLVAAGCGSIPLDDEPRVVESDDVPAALKGPTTTATRDTDPGEKGVDAELYFYLTTNNMEYLAPCSVSTAAGGSVEARTRAVLQRLINLDPATNPECPPAFTNAVPPDLLILDTELRVEQPGNILELNVGRDAIVAIEATQQRRAIAQLVFTATSVPGVTAVRFFADGQPISVPVEDRTADPGEPVRPSDFPGLVAALERLNELLAPPVIPRQPELPPIP